MQKFIVPELQSVFDQHCWKAAVSLYQRLMSAAASDAEMLETAVAAVAADVASLSAEVCAAASSSSRHISNQDDLRDTLMQQLLQQLGRKAWMVSVLLLHAEC
jgi:hypothetical protein